MAPLGGLQSVAQEVVPQKIPVPLKGADRVLPLFAAQKIMARRALPEAPLQEGEPVALLSVAPRLGQTLQSAVQEVAPEVRHFPVPRLEERAFGEPQQSGWVCQAAVF